MDLQRYIRQMRYYEIGEAGQQKLAESRALIVGCGALGSVLANTLTRAGVGRLRLVDRDFLELNNLQRQVLYDENDVQRQLPKAICAAERLQSINSLVEIEPVVTDVDHTNIQQLLDGVDVMLDGTDNFETRFLMNDAAVKWSVPWVYGGCLEANGQTMTILPGETPCLRCLHPEPPAPGTTETCDSAGIVGPIINVIASIEALEGMKIMMGRSDAVNRELQVIDLWDNRSRAIKLDSLKPNDCPCCERHEFPWLDGARQSQSAVLCGRDSVQLSFPDQQTPPLDRLEEKLNAVGTVRRNPFLLRCDVDRYRITIFADGRAIIGGTEDIAEARTVYAKYVGN